MCTLYIMGPRVPVDGEVVGRAFTLTSDAKVGTHGSSAMAPLKLIGTHKPDDTLEGEAGLARGPMKWTAERLPTP